MIAKPVIVGQAPSRSSDPREPLSGKSGRRLAGLCGISIDEFLAAFERVNLLDAWPGKAVKGDAYLDLDEGRAAAERLRARLSGRKTVLLGFRTAAFFRVAFPVLAFHPHWGGEVAFCPHPSGIVTWWNDPKNDAHARTFWTELAAIAK